MLFLYEIKKLLKNKLFVLFLVALLIVNAFNIYSICRNYLIDDTYKLEIVLTDKFEGEITKEKIDLILNEYTKLSKIINDNSYSTEYDASTYTGYQMMDYNVFSKLYDEISRIYNFPNNTEKKINELKQTMKLFNENKNQRQYKNVEKIANAISQRNINEIHNYKGVDEYLNYNFSFLLIVIISALVAVLLFSTDKEMVNIIYTEAYSKKRIFMVKTVVLCMAVSLVVVLFKIVDFVSIKALIGLRGINSPLYYLAGYDFTGFNGSILGFSALNMISIIIKALFISTVCSLISMIIRKATYSMMLSILAIGLFVAFVDSSINQDFIYPAYVGLIEMGYIKIVICLVILIVLLLTLFFVNKRILKNGNIKI